MIYNGVPKDFPDKPHEKVKKLLDEAIAAFGVKAGDRLHLRTSVVKGG